MIGSSIVEQTITANNSVLDTAATGFTSNKAISALDSLQSQSLVNWTNKTLSSAGVEGDAQIYIRTALLLLAAVGLSFILWWVTKKILIVVIHRFAHKSKTKWDDYLVKNKVFSAIAHLVPFVILDFMIQIKDEDNYKYLAHQIATYINMINSYNNAA